jgi:hypothetical protein
MASKQDEPTAISIALAEQAAIERAILQGPTPDGVHRFGAPTQKEVEAAVTLPKPKVEGKA